MTQQNSPKKSTIQMEIWTRVFRSALRVRQGRAILALDITTFMEVQMGQTSGGGPGPANGQTSGGGGATGGVGCSNQRGDGAIGGGGGRKPGVIGGGTPGSVRSGGGDT